MWTVTAGWWWWISSSCKFEKNVWASIVRKCAYWKFVWRYGLNSSELYKQGWSGVINGPSENRLYCLMLCCSCSLFFWYSFQVVTFLLLNMYMHVQWSLHAIIHSPAISEASLSSLLAKRDFLSERLEYLLNSCLEMEGNHCNQLARWVRICILNSVTISEKLW